MFLKGRPHVFRFLGIQFSSILFLSAHNFTPSKALRHDVANMLFQFSPGRDTANFVLSGRLREVIKKQ